MRFTHVRVSSVVDFVRQEVAIRSERENEVVFFSNPQYRLGPLFRGMGIEFDSVDSVFRKRFHDFVFERFRPFVFESEIRVRYREDSAGFSHDGIRNEFGFRFVFRKIPRHSNGVGGFALEEKFNEIIGIRNFRPHDFFRNPRGLRQFGQVFGEMEVRKVRKVESRSLEPF